MYFPKNIGLAFALTLLSLSIPINGFAQSVYQVEIDTSAVAGASGKLALSLISNRPQTNRVDVFNFTTDGRLTLPETSGGLVAGDLIEGKMPSSFTRISGGAFFNELAINFESFGKQIAFTIDVSESLKRDGRPLDRFAVYLMDAEGNALIPFRFGRAAEQGEKQGQGSPNFTVSIDGERGGRLEILGQRIDRVRRGKIEAMDPERDLRVRFNVTPAWVSLEEENSAKMLTFEGTLQEFCTRRCVGQPTCAGGEFGVALAEDKFLRFDDVGNLKARVAIVESEVRASAIRIQVTGSLIAETVLRVREVTVK